MRCAIGYKGVFIINHFLSGKQCDDVYLNRMGQSINRHKMLFNTSEYESDIFISTYDLNKIMIDKLYYFSPKKIDVINFNQSLKKDNALSQISQHRNLIRLIKEYENENNILYDLIIITRLDLEFHKNLNEMNIDYDKFNIVVNHKSGNCDDNLWIFPRKYLDNYDNTLNDLLYNNEITHAINHYLLKNKIDLNYMDNLIDTYMGHTYFSFIR
jgi:hypothetical protein